MKYFIDFEATQYSGQIISIGCVDENGREFYSLIKPKKERELTGFILDLTHIDRDELLAAPSADEVFTTFFAWIDKSAPVEFYCYGDSDAHFLGQTRKRLTTFEGQLGLSVISGALVDYSPQIKKHFELKTSIALRKVVSYYRGAEVEQTHNSLTDALFLKEVYEKSRSEKTVEGTPFPEYKIGANLQTVKRLIRAEKGNIKMVFTSYGKAADWIMNEHFSVRDTVNDKTRSKVCSRIMVAAEKNRPYCGYRWSVENRAGAAQPAE